MKPFTFSLFLFFNYFVSFSQNKEDVVGTWKYFTDFFFEHTLIINNDSTYSYEIVGDMIEKHSEGKWLLKKNKLILNSKLREVPISDLIEIKNETSVYEPIDSLILLEFDISDYRGKPLEFTPLTITFKNSKLDTFLINSKSILPIPSNQSLYKLFLSSIGYQSILWDYRSGYNKFVIKLAPIYQDYIIMKEDKWIIKNGKLYNSKTRKDTRTYSKEAQNRKNFFERIITTPPPN